MTSIYNSQCGGNILVVGKTCCGKTTFLEKLGIFNFFGNLVKIEWRSGIDTDEKREAKTQLCFSNETGNHTAKEPDEIDSLIETLKLRTRDIVDDNDDVNSLFGKNKKMDRLIVMDDFSGAADISRKFATFFIVSTKFEYHCVYVFTLFEPCRFGKKLFHKLIFLKFFLQASVKIVL